MLEVVAATKSCIFIYIISMFVVNSGPLITAERLVVFIRLLLLENGKKSVIIQYVILNSYISNFKSKKDLQILSVQLEIELSCGYKN
jgi:hypothetical protein